MRLACLLILLAGCAQAGAWTQPPGGGFASLSLSGYETDDGGYREATVSAYGEWGWREAVTLGGSIETAAPEGDGAQTTLSTLVRARLRTGAAGDPTSVQLAVFQPFGDASAREAIGAVGDTAVEARLLYGRGFGTRYGDMFVDLQAGPRFEFGDAADELRLDATVGLRPAPRWIVLGQAFGTLGLRNARGEGDDYDVLKLAPSVGYEIAEGLTLVFGVEREVLTRDIDRGLRARLSLWRAF
ncbi:MAG: hypothetical protein EA355_02500 [Rhodobacteraceae bacterium]|nr:MAG: hypothetical protein EA355_02500 [Paracoccaceae bacterium]